MRLLIITQKVDKKDPILGFFHRWIEEFAKRFEFVTVICLEKGKFSLPNNVKVLSLGKEEHYSKVRYIVHFYKYIWSERSNYNVVFIHMNQEYVLLGGLLWKLFNRKIVLWYTHKQVSLTLRIAEKLADTILTSSRESFGIKSRKVQYLGHGIDTKIFRPLERDWANRTLLSVGRITPIKNCQVLIDSLSVLIRKDPKWQVVFVGDPVTDPDKIYKKELEDKIKKNEAVSSIQFAGSLTPIEIKNRFSKVFASVNMTPTGGMDKVVLESLATGCPVFTSNATFRDLFGEYSSTFIFSFGNALDLAQKIEHFNTLADGGSIINRLSEKVRREYGVESIIAKISNILST